MKKIIVRSLTFPNCITTRGLEDILHSFFELCHKDARSEMLSGRAVTSYDVHLGTCVLSWNTAEHYVTRLHFGTRCVVVVHFRKV